MLDGWQYRRLFSALAIALMLAVVAPTTASANSGFKNPTEPKAKKHLETGNRFYKLQNFKDAITEYKAGALIEDLPIFLYNLGQSYRQLGDYANAIWYYKRFLSAGAPSGRLKTWVKDVIKDMNKELQRAARNKPPTGPGPGTTPPPVSKQPQPRPQTDSSPWYSDKIGWALTSVGVIGLGLGGGLFVNASGLDDDAEREPDQVRREELRTLADDRRGLGTISAIVGGALVVGGIIKLVLHSPKNKSSATASSYNVAVGARWVGLVGRF